MGRTASAASLATDLELARKQNKRLRTELDQLLKQSLLHLGQLSNQSLVKRVDELTKANQPGDQRRLLADDNQQLGRRAIELEDGLTAASASFHNVMRQINTTSTSDDASRSCDA
ncbi:hypothetical protein [Actinomadura sp. 3N508]|uniref:hypothetical protein n=1 Tax=Actinomadura sp. 3N508 TaxID=3375153 RepID=UPI0037A68E3A